MKKILLSALAIVAMTGCTKTQSVNEELPDKPIVVTTNVIASKAIAVDGTVFGLQYVRDDKETQDWSAALTDATHQADNSVAFTETYSKDNEKSYFKFFSNGGTKTDTKIAWIPTGKEDIVYNKVVWDAGSYTSPVTSGLTFDHMLTRIEVILEGKLDEDLGAITNSWGNITGIKIAGLPNDITYDYASGEITYGALIEGVSSVALLAGTTYADAFASVAIGANANKTVAGGIMLPSGTSITKVKLLITNAKSETKDVEATFVAAIEAGKINTITLTFSAKNKAVSVSSTVTAWGIGSAGSGSL